MTTKYLPAFFSFLGSAVFFGAVFFFLGAAALAYHWIFKSTDSVRYMTSFITHLISELVRRLDRSEQTISNTLFQCLSEAVLGEGDAWEVRHDVFLDGGGRGPRAILERLDRGSSHGHVSHRQRKIIIFMNISITS